MKTKTKTEGAELKVLVLEDSPRDLELMRELLLNAGYRLDLTHVENEAGFTAALRKNSFDLILADFKLPGFDGYKALQISRELCPETPFICVSGTIGEETAVELLKLGAVDYVLKDKPNRLPYAVKRALKEAKVKTDYQKAAEALRESEEKIRNIYRVAPTGIGVVADRVLKEVNSRFCEMTGYTREELIDKNARLLYPSREDYEFVGKNKYDQIKAKGTGEVETRWQKKDGTIINVLLASTLIDLNDPSKGVAFTALDITERKQAEEALRLSEKNSLFLAQTAFELVELTSIQEIYKYTVHKLHELFEGNSMVALVEYNHSENRWKMQQVEGIGKKSAELSRLLGFDIMTLEGDISTKYYEQITSGKITELEFDFPNLFNNKLSTAVGSAVKKIFSIEKMYCISYQQDEQIIGNITFTTNKKSEPICTKLIEAFIQQVSNFVKKQKAEECLKESEEKFRSLAENTSDVIATIDLQGKITFISRMIEEETGYTKDEIESTNIQKILIPESYNLAMNRLQKRLNGEYLNTPFEVGIVTKTGKVIPFELNTSAITENGEIKGIQIVARDITERKKAEEAQRESDKTFRNIVQASPLGMHLYQLQKDDALVFTGANPAADSLLGINHMQFIGKTIEQLFPALKDTEMPDRYRRAARYGENWHTEQIDYDHANIKGVFEVHAFQMSPGNVGVLFTDITERKRTVMIKQLQYNIARATINSRNLNELFDSVKKELNSIIDANNFMIAFYNEETGMLNANVDRDEKDKIPEWPAEKSITGYVIRQNRPLLLQKNEILRLHEEGIIELFGTVSEAWLGVPLKAEGKMLGAVVVQNYDKPDVYDQTSLEIMELVAHELSMFIDRQIAKEKATKLSRVVEQSSVSIVITNREGVIEYVNPFFTELTGFSLEEVKGKNPNILNSGHQSTAFYKELWDTILSGNDWEGEMLNKKKNGNLFWEKAIISPIVSNDEVITNFVSIKQDITERKKIIEELVAAREKALKSDKLKTAFINNISHEIRTPLNGILGFGHLLLDPEISMEDKEEMLAIVQKSGNRLMNTITDYMDMARIVSGSMEVYKKEFLLLPFFKEIIEETRQLCAGKQIDFEFDYQIEDADLTIDSDPELINKILKILLDNALKFTDSGKISCGCKLKECFIEIFVKDTGKGIIPEMMDVIFTMFTQEDPSNTRGHEGSGLGLSIAGGMVKLLGGTISATSEKGMGSTFAFTLPYAATEPAEKAPTEKEKNTSVAGKPLVLVAEDEESNYLYMEVVLKKAGCDYLLAKNGEEAVVFCKQYPNITLVLMDIKMPVMNGLEATRLIREFRPELPIIATTAYVQTGDEQRFLAGGCDDYLPKPIKKENILALLQKYTKT